MLKKKKKDCLPVIPIQLHILYFLLLNLATMGLSWGLHGLCSLASGEALKVISKMIHQIKTNDIFFFGFINGSKDSHLFFKCFQNR